MISGPAMTQHLLALATISIILLGQVQAASEKAREARPVASKPATSTCPPGFAALQDASTCVRISGRVRAESVISSSRTRSSNSFTTQTGGRVQLDIRKQTELGPLRAVIRAEGVKR